MAGSLADVPWQLTFSTTAALQSWVSSVQIESIIDIPFV
jgi:hypothetical protein